MDAYKLKFTRIQNEIFRLICIKSGEKMSQRQIAKILNVSPTAISKSIPNLEKKGLIKIEKEKNMRVKYILLNRDSKKAISFKRIENLKMIYELDLIGFLEEKFPIATIVLFGSYSKGEDTINSDIDIAVIGLSEKEINLKKFEAKLERKIYLHFYNSLNEIHKNLRENILNGIILSGGFEL